MNTYNGAHSREFAATHEAGHALISSLLAENTRASIDAQAGGWTRYWLPDECDDLEKLRRWCCVALGGAVACELLEGRAPERLDAVAVLRQEREHEPGQSEAWRGTSFSELTEAAADSYQFLAGLEIDGKPRSAREIGDYFIRSIAPGCLRRACKIISARWDEVEDIAAQLEEIVEDGRDSVLRIIQEEE
jgi:hypothetical protein